MDRKSIPPAAGNEERPSSPQVSVSPHTPSQPEDLPPAYTTNGALQTADTSVSTLDIIKQFPRIDYSSYRPPSSSISSDHTKITTSHRPFCKSAATLTKFIQQQAALPPRPFIRIKGISESGNTEFNLKIDLLPYLYRTREPWNYFSLKSDTDAEPSSSRGPSFRRSQSSNRSLETWAKEFCSDSASIKTFTLERQVVNFDIERLAGLVRNTFADLRFRGQLEVQMETTFTKVVVDNQPTKGAGAFFRPLVSAFVGSKDYEVVKAVWPFARSAPDESSSSTREFATISELAWWKEWKVAAAKAAFERRTGWVTTEDRLEVVMTGWLQDATERPMW
ncbi:MAG: hypothetical protein GOMPHAMPRED_006953 [Gomphillus americanus]|uniref:Uncharacterized protein n=1 Tax=Gomphillus americanus TaxID=1940652 RepID=A0A8H3ETQ6_9LECA|nr:MAG: hypothetical protein GOMPHAMPRED_006953 [Gomphillus americanus]